MEHLPPIMHYRSIDQYMDDVDFLEKILSTSDSYSMEFYQNFLRYYEHLCIHQTIDIIKLMNQKFDQLFVVALDPLLKWTIPNRCIKNNSRLSIVHFQVNKYQIIDNFGRNIISNKEVIRNNIVDILNYTRFLTFDISPEDLIFFDKIEYCYIQKLFHRNVFGYLERYNKFNLYQNNQNPLNFPKFLLFDNLHQSLLYKQKMLNVLSSLTIHNVGELKQL